MRIFLWLAAILCFNTIMYAQTENSNLTVQVRQGTVKGTIEKDVCVWKGIRYAQPPIGPLRFKAPLPLPASNATIDATHFGNIASQPKNPIRGKGKASEDCLFLNIWRPAFGKVKKPVLFWVHGGGFNLGSGSDALYDGSALARNGNIIVVTFNYRLGPLGFLDLRVLDTDSLKFDANLGLRDQIAALKWVKENISAFGGDPDNITIAGESAGGAAVVALMASPYARGLFQKAIVESCAGKSIYENKDRTLFTREYLDMLGITAVNTSKLYSLPADSFFEATKKMAKKHHWSIADFQLFWPVMCDDFLPLDINDAIKKGAAKGIPLLIGTNKDEYDLLAKLRSNKPTTEKINRLLSQHGFTDMPAITSVYTAYSSRNAMLAIFTDAYFRIPSIRIAEAQSAFAPTYMYRFDWASSTLKMFGFNACHGIELPFVFGSFHSSRGGFVILGSKHSEVKALTENIQAGWINFIKTGSPNTAAYQWPQYDTDKRNTLIFDNTVHIISDPDSVQRVAWGEGH